MALLRRRTDTVVLELLEESAGNVRRATVLLRDLFIEYPERAELAGALVDCEHEGDRITHDIIHRLNGGGQGRAPLSPKDGLELATALDDIVDFAEQAAGELALYAVEAPMEQAAWMAEVLVQAAGEVACAVGCLRSQAPIAEHLVEIHRLENDADRLSRDAVAALFERAIDPIAVIRWKDIFETLEQSVDACEKVAHVLEGITLKQRHGVGA